MDKITGSFRVRDALAEGMSAGQLKSAHLSAPFHGVRSVVAPDSHVAMCRAYSAKMRADAAFTAISAARIWGIPLPLSAQDDRVHVSTPHDAPRATGRGVLGRQHDPLHETIVEVDGLRVLAPVDAWISLGRLLTFAHLVVAADFLLTRPFGASSSPLATVDDLHRALLRRRIPARPRLLAAARFALPGPLSPAESLCRVLLVSAGIPAPVPNLRISPLVTLDLAWANACLGLDYLGDHHRSPSQFARDVERRAVIRELGWGHLEATKADLYQHPYQLVTRTRARLSERGVTLTRVHPSKYILPTL